MVQDEDRHSFVQNVSLHAVAHLEPQQFAVAWIQDRFRIEPLDGGETRAALVSEHHCAGGIGKEAGADQHAGIVVELKGRAANFDADREHLLRGAGFQERAGQMEIWKGGAETVPHEIGEVGIGSQAKAFADVTGEAGTDRAGAGADKERIELLEVYSGLFSGAAGGGFAHDGRVFRKSAMQRVWIERESLVQIFQDEIACLDSRIAGQHLAENRE